MTRLALRSFALVALALLLAGCADSSAENPPAAASGEIGVEDMAGLNFSGLTDAQKATIVSVMNTEGCNCSCGMTLARCRRDDSTCRTSLGLGSQVIALAKQGKSHAQIVAALNRPGQPSRVAQAQQVPKFIEFPLQAGDNTPAHGPDGPPVTILHYPDYQ